MVSLRLQRFLSQAGIASRREAEELILQGRVTVDGREVRELGVKVDPRKQDIRVDGERVKPRPLTYILLYKPRGFLCTRHDPRGRPTIYHLVPQFNHLFPVGRLDYDAEGLLLLTNDGELAYNLTHPGKEVEKTYLVKVKGVPEERDLARLRKGIIMDGRKTAPAKISFMRRTLRNSWLKVTIHEGRYRQIKRMFLAIGHPVIRIKRTALAFLRIEGLKPGMFRALTEEEIRKLKEWTR